MSNFSLWVKRHSPEILLGVGITNFVASVGLASWATYNVNKKIINPTKKNINKIHAKYDIDSKNNEELQKEEKKELRKVYIKAGWEILKIYSPAFISLAVGITSCVFSNRILNSRNIALGAAFTTLKAGYDAYRLKVKSKIGDEEEEELFKGESIVEKIRERSETSEGKEKVIEKEVKHYNPNDKKDCDFGVFWGPGNADYDAFHSSLNMTKLLQAEQYFNQKLRAKKYVFLHEIYEELGFRPNMLGQRKLQAAHVLGWVYDPSDQNRDNYISFGIHDKDGALTEAAKRFQCGLDDFIWLEFNVDDDILTGNNGKKTFMSVAVKEGM